MAGASKVAHLTKVEVLEICKDQDTQELNKPLQGDMTRTSLYISKDMLKSIKTEALKQDTTFNDVTRKLLKKWLFENSDI